MFNIYQGLAYIAGIFDVKLTLVCIIENVDTWAIIQYLILGLSKETLYLSQESLRFQLSDKSDN